MYKNKEIFCDCCHSLIPEYKQFYIKTSAPKLGLRVDIRTEAKKGAKTYCNDCIEKKMLDKKASKS